MGRNGRDEGEARGWMSKLFSQGEENVITVTFWWILQIRDKILEDINIIGHATLYQRTCGHPPHHPFWILSRSIRNEENDQDFLQENEHFEIHNSLHNRIHCLNSLTSSDVENGPDGDTTGLDCVAFLCPSSAAPGVSRSESTFWAPREINIQVCLMKCMSGDN